MTSPETLHVSAPVVVHVFDESCTAATRYPVIGDPPVLLGADHETVAWAFAGTAWTLSGTLGGPSGTTAAEDADTGPDPITFEASTLNV